VVSFTSIATGHPVQHDLDQIFAAVLQAKFVSNRIGQRRIHSRQTLRVALMTSCATRVERIFVVACALPVQIVNATKAASANPRLNASLHSDDFAVEQWYTIVGAPKHQMRSLSSCGDIAASRRACWRIGIVRRNALPQQSR